MAASTLLFTLTFTAPYLAHSEMDFLAGLNYVFFSEVCHQRPDRSFFLWGERMGVCARCLGFYGGLLMGSLAYPLTWREKDGRGRNNAVYPPAWLLLAAAVPLTVDGGTQLLGLRESSNVLRLATGLLLGSAVPHYLIPAFNDIFRQVWGFLYGTTHN